MTSFESLKIVLINVVATLGLLKIKVYWNKSYDAMISVHDATNKILSLDSNYIVDVIKVC